jgi:lysophospholipase
MANMTYAGTHLANGQPPNNTGCVTGFDETGFLMGTSASLFNEILDSATTSLSSSDDNALEYLLAWQLREVRTRANDVANWPNPFNGVKSSTFQDSNSTWLELVDGSSNQENIPLNPLFVNARELDVVVAIDSGGDDAEGWPKCVPIRLLHVNF